MRRRSAEVDIVNADFGELLPMSLLTRIVFAALELEDDDFVFKAVLNDFAGDFSTGERWDTRANGIAIGAEQHVVEFNSGTGISQKGWYPQRFARLCAELFPTGSDDCVAHDEDNV